MATIFNITLTFSFQWLNFGYLEISKTAVKGAHQINGIARMLQRIYIPALCKCNSWGGLTALQVRAIFQLNKISFFIKFAFYRYVKFVLRNMLTCI